MKHTIILLLLIAAVSSCNNKQEDKISHDLIVSGDTIIVSNHSPLREKLKTGRVKEEPYQMEFTTSCAVKAIPTNYAEIASPFAGRITKSFVRLGQKVVPGSPVFEISSPSFFETGKTYYQAKQEMELALKSLKREQDLLQNRVGVQKEKEEAEVNYELKKKDYENALASLKVYQINPDELVLGKPLIIRSPIAGEVVKNNVVLGQYMKEDAEPEAVIANLSKVWVVANVKEKDLGLIQNLKEVEVRLIAMPDKVIKGKIYHISEMLDEETRSIEVLIECENSERIMKPGMYGTVKLADSPTNAIFVPTAAILQDEDNSYVFVSLGANKYEKRKVITATSANGKTVVLSGLSSGENIVTSGAFYLIGAR